MKQEKAALRRQMKFIPPYCPNEACAHHIPSKSGVKFYRSKGWANTVAPPYAMRRFRCVGCKKTFSYSSFKLDYRNKKKGLNHRIFELFICGSSNRQIGRVIGYSERLVRDRLKKMAQWSLVRHNELIRDVKISEPIAYDGLENFAYSQYDPNHIQQCVGSKSLFIYDFNFAPLNRKGRMSDRQKIVREQLEAQFGRYQPRAIRIATREIIKRIYAKWDQSVGSMVLLSDEHFQYKRAVKRDLKDLKIQHATISSKETRNYQNILFPVNHSDLLIRQHVGAFSRETICFSKTAPRMIQKFALFMVWKNFFRSLFVKEHVKRPEATVRTPAMELEIGRAHV